MMDIAVGAPAQLRASRVRYWILTLIFIVTTVNYADRATLSVTGPAMRAEFGIDALEMGYIFSAFSWAYVLAQLPGGLLLDRFGPRRVYAASILLWSLFTLLQSTLGLIATMGSTVVSLFFLRFCVGLAEAPAFPANAKMAASWFPAAERGTASAFYNSAQYFAPVVFTPLMAWMVHAYSWHHVYIWMGLLGFVVAGVWLFYARQPEEMASVNAAELQLIRGNEQDTVNTAAGPSGNGRSYLRTVLTNRTFLGVYIGQYCINVLTYFFLTWFPIYLVQQRGMNILQAGFVASLPAICGFAGGILGGVISDRLTRAGFSLTAARKIPIVTGLLLSTTMICCNYVQADWLVVGFMALAFFGKGIGALGWAVISDIAPSNLMGLSGGMFNMFGNVAGIVTPIVIGYIVNTTGSFNGALVFVGLNALVAVLSYLFVVGKIQRF